MALQEEKLKTPPGRGSWSEPGFPLNWTLLDSKGIEPSLHKLSLEGADAWSVDCHLKSSQTHGFHRQHSSLCKSTK
jgi:hypothetical protein